jgi:signal transduction histidine kinase
VAVEPVSTMISAPPEWLDRLLGVLVDNACRYTPAGGTVDVRVGRQDNRVRLAVEDSGPGIAPQERSHIFDRFRRASETPGGSGLGLAIAAAVVGSSGGRWDVGTSVAGGASMAVSWTPLIRSGSEAEEAGVADAPPGGPGALAPPPPPRPA